MKISFNIDDKYVGVIKYAFLVLLIFFGIAYVYFFQGGNTSAYLMLATIFAIYMALNLGANDVANNMGPAVGSKALTIGTALLLAVIFEATGAIIAGGDVVDTIKSGIIDKNMIGGGKEFISIMLATLLGAAIWLNIATLLKAPVSTTNSIVGGLIGGGLAAAGPAIVKWSKVGEIAASWVISLLMGGIISVIIFVSIRKTILKAKDKGEAAKRYVPVYVGIIVAIFSVYLFSKGLKPIAKSNEFLMNYLTSSNTIFIGISVGLITFLLFKYKYSKYEQGFFVDSKKFVNRLFNFPLIFAVSLLCFAHGSNDVANAIGPLAAVYETVKSGGTELAQAAGVPAWILLLGAFGLSGGLAVFGGRLIKTVGNEITKIDQVRAFCIALSTASTVLIASALGLPVSSTQITLGAIFGIGLFRQHISRRKGEDKQIINLGMMKGIILSWIVTLPISGLLAAGAYYIIMMV